MKELTNSYIESLLARSLEGKEILGGLIDIKGKRVAEDIVLRSLQGGIIYVMGKPGSGKTTVFGQTVEATEHLAGTLGISLVSRKVFYEYVLARVGKDTPELNEWLFEEIMRDESGVTYVEAPSVGKTYPKDRAVSTFKRLARERGDSFFVYLIAHPLNQLRGIRFRADVVELADIEDIDIARYLQEKHNVILVSPKVGPEEVRCKLKSFVKSMANQRHMREIGTEVWDQADSWWVENKGWVQQRLVQISLAYSYWPHVVEGMLNQEYLKMHDDSNLSLGKDFVEQLKRDAETRSDSALLEAAYAESVFRDELGLGKDRYTVVFSPPYSGPIHLYLP